MSMSEQIRNTVRHSLPEPILRNQIESWIETFARIRLIYRKPGSTSLGTWRFFQGACMNNSINNSDVPPDANALVPATAFSSFTGAAGIGGAIAKARRYAAASCAASSHVAMASNFRHFETWCRRLGLISVPATPETVAL